MKILKGVISGLFIILGILSFIILLFEYSFVLFISTVLFFIFGIKLNETLYKDFLNYKEKFFGKKMNEYLNIALLKK